MWTIFSIGDFNLLVTVLNAVAALTAPGGSAGLGFLVMTGFIIGALLLVLRAIITGRLELQYLLIGWLGYMLMFGVKAPTTNVEDVYTGASTPVANVPIGIAAFGGIVSGIGYQLTEAFETAFTVPTLTGEGYLDALNALMIVRGQGAGSANSIPTGAAAAAPGPEFTGDVEKSLINYVKDCVIYDIEMALPTQDVTIEDLQMSPDLWQAMRVNSSVWTTTTYIPGVDPDAGTVRTCVAAYGALNGYLTGTFFPAWNNYLAEITGIADPQARIDSALTSLVAGGINAQDYMLDAFLANIVRQGDMARSADLGSTTSVLIKSQAMEQRRTQWAAEQSLFLEIARPLMAFVESFSYAISPIMAFLVTLGSMGITLLGKYLLLMVWIQLWTPILAICNLYINMAANAKLSGIHSISEVTSMRGLDNLYTEAASYLATGGMLAGATPMFALFLLGGSMYTFTNLAQRFQGRDHINEKLGSPDIRNTPAMMDMSAAAAWSPTQGLTHHGAGSVMTSMNIGQQHRIDTQSAKQEASTAQNNFLEEYSSMVGSKWGFSDGGGHSDILAAQERASGSQSNAVIKRHTSDFKETFGLNEREMSMVQGMLGAQMAGDRSAMSSMRDQLSSSLSERYNSGSRAGLTGSFQGTESVASEKVQQIMSAVDKMASADSGFRAEYSTALANDHIDKVDTTYNYGKDATNNSSVREAAQDAISATESYQELEATSHSMGANVSLTSGEFGQAVKDRGAGNELAQLVLQNNLSDSVNRHLQSSEMSRIHDPKQRLAAAQGLALFGGSIESRQDLAEFVADRLGYGTPTEVANANKFEGVGDSVQPGEAQAAVANGNVPRDSVQSLKGTVDKEVSNRATSQNTAVLNGGDQVADKFNTTTGGLAEKLTEYQKENHDLIKPILDEVMGKDADRFLPTLSEVSNALPNTWEAVKLNYQAGEAAIENQNKAVQQMVDSGKWSDMSWSEQSEFMQAASDAGWNQFAGQHYQRQYMAAQEYLSHDEAQYYALSDTIFKGATGEAAEKRLAQLEESIGPNKAWQIRQALHENRPERLKTVGLADFDSPISQQQRDFGFNYVDTGNNPAQPPANPGEQASSIQWTDENKPTEGGNSTPSIRWRDLNR